MQGILGDCFSRASRRADRHPSTQAALRDTFSCYYSGNFLTGHQHGYVGKVLAAWSSSAKPPGNAPSSAVAGLVRSQDRLSVFASKPATFTSTNPGASQ